MATSQQAAANTHHHEVELAVGRADGLEHEGDLAEVAAGHPRQRGRNPEAETQTFSQPQAEHVTKITSQLQQKCASLLEPGDMQGEDEIIVIRTAGSAADVVSCHLPSW